MRSLDFTSCVNTTCKKECWRKLTQEEQEWLSNNPNRHSQSEFNCEEDIINE